jgi:hypothetical protein
MKPVVILSAIGPDGKTWSVSVCPKCRRTCLDERMAEECCTPRICKCGTMCRTVGYTICDDCRAAEYAKRDTEKTEKARKIPASEYSGPLYDGSEGVYYPDVDSAIDHYADREIPRYLWACEKIGLTLDASYIIDCALENQEHHEDARDSVGDINDLQTILDEWLDKNSCVESWVPLDDLAVDMWDGAR